MYQYKTRGTCSEHIFFEIENDVITKCRFTRGCSGNLQGISRLVVGHTVDEVISMLKGIQCQNGTSCPDQLTHALEAYKAGELKEA